MIGAGWTPIAGTLAVWGVSAGLAIVLALMLAAGSRYRPTRVVAAWSVIHLSRGIPTSLLVVGFGMTSMRIALSAWLPTRGPCCDPAAPA